MWERSTFFFPFRFRRTNSFPSVIFVHMIFLCIFSFRSSKTSFFPSLPLLPFHLCATTYFSSLSLFPISYFRVRLCDLILRSSSSSSFIPAFMKSFFCSIRVLSHRLPRVCARACVSVSVTVCVCVCVHTTYTVLHTTYYMLLLSPTCVPDQTDTHTQTYILIHPNTQHLAHNVIKKENTSFFLPD